MKANLAAFLAIVLAQGSMPGRAEEPKNAAEALVMFQWDFSSPLHSGRLTFLPGGRIQKSWPDKVAWRWQASSERVFVLRLAGAKGEKLSLTFDEGFTRFEGPGFRKGQTFRGTRAEKAPPTESSESAIAPPKSTPEPAASPAPAPKNTLDSLAEDGPFITDQVLAAIDLPSVSEATVALWREDLLDEAAHASAAAQPVYRQAAALVDAWKSALRERDQITGQTKYAVAIETTDMSSSRKTTLHLRDWLQYARERNDAARHERRLERSADFFASGPAKRWAERSAVLRPYHERLYAVFRKLRRELPASDQSRNQP